MERKGWVTEILWTIRGSLMRLNRGAWVRLDAFVPSSVMGRYVICQQCVPEAERTTRVVAGRYVVGTPASESGPLGEPSAEYGATARWLQQAGWGTVVEKVNQGSPHLWQAIELNPFILVLSRMTNFGVADAIWLQCGRDPLASCRLEAGLHQVLRESYKQGECGIPADAVSRKVERRLRLPSGTVDGVVLAQRTAKVVVTENLVQSESVVRQLEWLERTLAENQLNLLQVPDTELSWLLGYRFALITGPPLSGKSHTLRELAGRCERHGLRVALTAMTGKAASLLGPTGQTLHRLLGYGARGFSKNVLEYDVIFIDEVSMLTLAELVALVKVSRGPIIGCGELGQLGPVEGLGVLPYLVDRVPVLQLKEVRGHFGFSAAPVKEIQFEEVGHLYRYLRHSVQRRQKEGAQVQVISPLRHGPLGMVTLNARLREWMNEGSGASQECGVGDPVIFCRRVEREGYRVPKGYMGTVRQLGPTGVEVELESGTVVKCQRADVELAYCLTVHRAQGSRFPYVMAVLPYREAPEFVADATMQRVARSRHVHETTCLRY